MRRDAGNVVSGSQKSLGYVGNGRKHDCDGNDDDAKGKKPWRADHAHRAGPCSGGDGGAVYIPHDEMCAQNWPNLAKCRARIS